jgi:hypothetical protein
MLFKKKPIDPLKSFIHESLDDGLKRMIREGLIDINSPLAGMYIKNYIAHMKEKYAEMRPFLAIKFSLKSQEVSIKVLEAINEFKSKVFKS